MRKFKHTSTLIIALFLCVMSACKKSFLETVPKGLLVPTTYEDYDQLMNYSGFYYYDAGFWQAAMLMGDDVSAEATAYTQNGTDFTLARRLFQWEDDVFIPSSDQFSSADKPAFLSRALSNLYSLNLIIKGVMDAQGGSEQQKKDIQAQAKATRAFINFQLLNYFAKPYNVATAVTDPGFPIITEPEATQTDFKRGTLQESYDALINDLLTAIPNLNIQPSFPTRMSKPAAEAFLGKVYLFMGKQDEALDLFNRAFADMAQMSHGPQLYNYNETLSEGGSFLPINPQTGPTLPFNSITDLTESLLATMSYAGKFGHSLPNDFLSIHPKTVALYGKGDLRLKFFTDRQPNQDPIPLAPGSNPARRLRKYGLTYSRIGMQLSELLLLRAEARARTNDLVGAKADLEELRRHRMPEADAIVSTEIASDRLALLSFIMDERIREFAAEGYRWFDMRRLSVDPLFAGQTAAQHILYGLDGTVNKEFVLKADRLTLRIPQPYLLGHPDMVDNP